MRHLAVFLCGAAAALLLALPGSGAAGVPAGTADPGVRVYLEGRPLPEAEALVQDGTVYLPLRAVSEALGRRVHWDGWGRRVDIW